MANRNNWACPCNCCVDHPRSAEALSHSKLNQLVSTLDEKAARRVVGLMAEQEGRGGTARFSRITGMSRTTILVGRRELGVEDSVPYGRVRRLGGGRKSLEKKVRA
jgi:hypothetical protein